MQRKQNRQQAEGLPQWTSSSDQQQQPRSGATVIVIAERHCCTQAASLPSTQFRHDPTAPERVTGPGDRKAVRAAPLAQRFGRPVSPSSQSDQPQLWCRWVDAPQREHLLGELLPWAPGWQRRNATCHLPATHSQRCRGFNHAPGLQALPARRPSASELGAGEADFL